MTNKEKREYLNKDTIAYYSGYAGIEIKDIIYGIDDFIVYVSGAWSGKRDVHKSKVYYTESGNSYFKYNGSRIPLNECIRCNAF